MPFGISNFERLPWHTKIAFEDAEVQLLAWLTKKPAVEGARPGNDGLSGIGATGALGAPGLVDAIASVLAGLEADGQWWRNGPWRLDDPRSPTPRVVVLRPPDLSAGTYHNYAPHGIDTAVMLEMEPRGAISLTGLRVAETQQSRLLAIRNRDSSATITLKHANTGSLVPYRFDLPLSEDLALGPRQIAWMYYDVGRQAWALFVTPHQAGGLATMAGGWTRINKAADEEHGQLNTTFTADADLIVPMTAGTTVTVRGFLLLESSGDGVNGGMQIRTALSGATVGLNVTLSRGAITTLGSDTLVKTFPTTSFTAATNSASLAGMFEFNTTAVVTGSGSLVIQYASLFTGGGDPGWKAIVKKGSWVEYKTT